MSHGRSLLKELQERPNVVSLESRLPGRGRATQPAWLEGRSDSPPAAPPATVPDPAADLEEARRLAEAEGLRVAQAKVEALVNRYLDGIERLGAAAESARRACAEDIVDLALVVAGELIGQEILSDREIIVKTVDHAIGQAGDGPIKVRLGRADIEYLQRRRPDVAAIVQLVEDPQLGVGGCVVETPRCELDASFGTRLAALRERLIALMHAEMDRPREIGEAAP
jgi:flagellar assembly protein FliH